MPFRFWTKQTGHTHMKPRVHRLEIGRKHLTTLSDVCKHWNDLAAGHGLIQRVRAQERWREDMDVVLLELMKDIAVIESRLHAVSPLGSSVDAASDRATTGSERSIRKSKPKDADLHTRPSKLSPSSLPSTFTERKGDGTERVALETEGLRLSQPGRHAKTGQTGRQSRRDTSHQTPGTCRSNVAASEHR